MMDPGSMSESRTVGPHCTQIYCHSLLPLLPNSTTENLLPDHSKEIIFMETGLCAINMLLSILTFILIMLN